MGKGLALSLAILLASGCSRADYVKDGVATDEGVAAIALPEEQYRYMLKRNALGTMSGPMYIGILGMDEGCDVLNEAVDKVVEGNLPQWRSNLITAYRDNIPPDRLAEAVQESPRRARSMLQDYLPAIANAMEVASAPLLRSSGIKVLEAMGDAAGKVDRATIDMEARQRDLARMKDSRQICGVG